MRRVINRYDGNTGRVRRVDETPPAVGRIQTPPPRPAPPPPPPVSRRPPSPLSGLSGELGRLLSRLSPMNLETDDLLLMMVLYLMYRESRDPELLYILGAMLFL